MTLLGSLFVTVGAGKTFLKFEVIVCCLGTSPVVQKFRPDSLPLSLGASFVPLAGALLASKGKSGSRAPVLLPFVALSIGLLSPRCLWLPCDDGGVISSDSPLSNKELIREGLGSEGACPNSAAAAVVFGSISKVSVLTPTSRLGRLAPHKANDFEMFKRAKSFGKAAPASSEQRPFGRTRADVKQLIHPRVPDDDCGGTAARVEKFSASIWVGDRMKGVAAGQLIPFTAEVDTSPSCVVSPKRPRSTPSTIASMRFVELLSPEKVGGVHLSPSQLACVVPCNRDHERT